MPKAKKDEKEKFINGELKDEPINEEMKDEVKESEGLEIPEDAKIEVTGEAAVDFVDAYGTYVRTYEESRHGAAYSSLAQDFVAKNAARGYKVVPAAPRSIRN